MNHFARKVGAKKILLCQRLKNFKLFLFVYGGLNISPFFSISGLVSKFPVFPTTLFKYFSPTTKHPQMLSFHAFSKDCLCMHSSVDMSMPLLSESYLLTSSVFLWRNQTVYLNLLYILDVGHPSFIPASLFPSHYPASVPLLLPSYLTS